MRKTTPCSVGVLLALMLVAGCEYYAKPNRPVPDSFEARYLDGTKLNAAALQGVPSVISVWVPG